MDKKIPLLIILILIISGGIFAYLNVSNGTFGNSEITVPDGFDVVRQNESEIVITNGITNYSVKELSNEKSISQHLDDCFSKYDEDDIVLNGSQTLSKVKVDTMVLKTDNNITVHAYYFYKANNKTFRLFSKGPYNHTAVLTLLNSTK